MTSPTPEPEPVTTATLATTFATIANSITTQAVEMVTVWWQDWLRGRLTDDEFAEVLGHVLDMFGEIGVMKADRLAADLLDRPAVGLTLEDSRADGYVKAAETVVQQLDQSDTDVKVETIDPDSAEDVVIDLPGRLERLATSEPTAAAQDGLRRAYEAHGLTGYTRGLDESPCELCIWLKKAHLREGGYVYPIDQPMNRHPGCCCVPIPVGTDELPEQTDNTTKEQRA